MQACGPSLRGSCPASGLPRANSRPRSSRTRVAAPCAGLGDAFKGLFDFESWAPRSSQAWRLGRSPDQQGAPAQLLLCRSTAVHCAALCCRCAGATADAPPCAETGMDDKDVDLLNERLAQARRSGSSQAEKRGGRAAATRDGQAMGRRWACDGWALARLVFYRGCVGRR